MLSLKKFFFFWYKINGSKLTKNSKFRVFKGFWGVLGGGFPFFFFFFFGHNIGPYKHFGINILKIGQKLNFL